MNMSCVGNNSLWVDVHLLARVMKCQINTIFLKAVKHALPIKQDLNS